MNLDKCTRAETFVYFPSPFERMNTLQDILQQYNAKVGSLCQQTPYDFELSLINPEVVGAVNMQDF